MATAQDDSSPRHGPGNKPCRACMDFKTWTKLQGKIYKESSESGRGHSTDVRSPPNCPVDRDELGQATWTFLHTMAAYYPDTPTHKEQDEMKQLIYSFSKFYPCNDCAYYMREWMKTHPPSTQDRHVFSRWMCDMHNEVNERLGKPIFDCSKVDERWLHGWKDGSCD